MSMFSQSSRSDSGGGRPLFLLTIFSGIIVGLVLRFVAPELLAATSIAGQVFAGLMFVISIPLVVSQVSLTLNNPRDRVRRGVSHSRILVQVLLATAVVLGVAATVFLFGAPADGNGFIQSFVSSLNPANLIQVQLGSSIAVALGFALVMAAILGALGDRAQTLVTICNRISRASFRLFRLMLWVAPIGMISFVGTLGLSEELPVAASMSAPVIACTGIAALFLYSTFVLGVEWIAGQLRSARKEPRTFDRDRRPSSRRYTDGPESAGRSSRPYARTGQRPGSDSRRERERSPFDMGVSSTPVLDIDSPKPPVKQVQDVRPPESGRWSDSRSRGSRETQGESRDSGRSEQQDSQRDSHRGFRDRDRGPRQDRRDGSREETRDRGPRTGRPDRPGRDRGPRRNNFERREMPTTVESSSDSPSGGPGNRPTPEAIAADLTKVREQLDAGPRERASASDQVKSPTLSLVNEPATSVTKQPLTADTGQPHSESSGETTEVQYGRSRHRKGDKSAGEPMLPGIEQPPLPEMIDHYSTDDMAFGRGKRKKPVK